MLPIGAMRYSVLTVALSACLFLPAATLEKLSMDDMIDKSTDIVCAKVAGVSTFLKGAVVYSRFQIQVSQRWKGNAGTQMDVVVPGGQYGTQRQIFSGAPRLQVGDEYVMFLWTGKSGLTQVIGLSQGLFDVKRNAQGEAILFRAGSQETMLDPGTGQPIADTALTMRLSDLVGTISRKLNQ